ncbi:MAG: hypothetical protein M0Z28_25270 [Rhodospirillales bacterium]|nr:hypothetical protein [Rhodospirillales bacterium]
MAPPLLTLTLGLHGSASTWAYNVAREAMAWACGADGVAACFADSPAELLAGTRALGRRVVCKTHGFPGLDVLAHLTQARLVATVRDPRDAVVSLMERFAAPLSVAVRGVAQDCQYAAWCAAAGHLLLRYEDRFFDDPGTVSRLAAHLGLALPAVEGARIFADWRTERVRAFAASVAALPAERLVRAGDTFLFDRLTQVHHTHVGDGRIGKWRERLDPVAQAELSRLFAPFLQRFGYAVN